MTTKNPQIPSIFLKSYVFIEFIESLNALNAFNHEHYIQDNIIDLSNYFSIKSIKELENIIENNLHNVEVDYETFKLIDFLDLNYLLFNYDIKKINEKEDIGIKRVDQYYYLMNKIHDKNFFKLFIQNLGLSSINHIDYKKLNSLINVCSNAVLIGNLEILKIARENECQWNVMACRYAAMNGDLKILKYLYENGCPWDQETCSLASRGGHLECLQFLYKNGCPWDEKTCTEAARNGHLKCLEFAYNNGCPWDIWTPASASRKWTFRLFKICS
jgi:hypothetical protein